METNKTYGKNGFKTPKGYFDNFEENILEKITKGDSDNKKVLSENISSGLNTPKNYFENLETSILEKTIHSKPEAKVISLISKKTILYFSGIAAMIAIIISITIPEKRDFLDDLETIDISYIQEYLNDEDIELEDSDIASLFNEEQEFITTLNDDELNDDTLIDYLSNEELENDLIYTE